MRFNATLSKYHSYMVANILNVRKETKVLKDIEQPAQCLQVIVLIDSVATYIVKRKPKRSKSEIWRDFNADDDISHGEYDSDCSVGVIVDSDDDFNSIFSDDNGADLKNLCVVGSQMPVEKADSKTDVDGNFADRLFYQPNATAATNEKECAIHARNSSSETERLIREEMEAMEKEKKLRENLDKKQEDHTTDVQPTQELQPQQATTKFNENSDVVRTIKDLHRVNKQNINNVSPRKQLLYGNMIQSTLDTPRTGTPQMFKKDPITETQRQELLTRFIKDSNNKQMDHKISNFGADSSSSNSLLDSSSGHGSLPSSSTLLPTVSSCGIVSLKSSVTAVQRERQREALKLDIIDIGRQDIQQRINVDRIVPSQENLRVSESVRRRVIAAFNEPKKPNLLQRIQTRLVRFERFVRKRLMSLSCTR